VAEEKIVAIFGADKVLPRIFINKKFQEAPELVALLCGDGFIVEILGFAEVSFKGVSGREVKRGADHFTRDYETSLEQMEQTFVCSIIT
jgi:hypothetical protein